MSTVLDLRAVWFNAADDLTDAMEFTKAGDAIGLTTTVQVDVRQNVNRRRIIIRGTGTYRSFALTLEECTPVQVTWLRDHVGQLVCVRDHVGSKAYVVYVEVSESVDTGYRDRSDVSLALDEIDHSEAV